MSNDVVISVENVSKKFCKSLKKSMIYGMHDIARNSLGLSAHSEKLRKKEFLAVDNVSFELKKGETLGLIGPNGSGKTTMLKMINGIFWPDKGKITIKGKVGALIAVGAGFHPMLTGRENIYINGGILGMTKRDIDRQFDSIVDFADIGDFLDTPVKNYSSGMYVRLGFAVAIHCEPDILLIDEVLAVGDKNFQIKCYQKMNEIRNSGVSIVLVSHNEYTIREQTSNCLYIKNGKMRFLGSSEEGINVYIKEMLDDKIVLADSEENSDAREDSKAQLETLKILDKENNEISFIETGKELNLLLECLIKEEIKKPIFGVSFVADNGFMYCANSNYENIMFEKCMPGKVRVKIKIPHLHLPVNKYLCSIVIAEERVDNLIDWQNMRYRLVVGRAENARGSVKLPTEWTIENE
jgi:lipopolysaccharide transport system ATP-binding protein